MYRRIKTAFGIITVCFAMLVVSIYNISLGRLSLTVNQKMQKHTDTVLLSKVRGTVYYRNFSPLAGKQLQKGVLVNPIKLDEQSLELLKENALFVSQQHIEDKINKFN
jgi:cell division protein FtsI/penicillin-binding protein 2